MILGEKKKWMAMVMASAVLVSMLGCHGPMSQAPVVEKAEVRKIEAGKVEAEKAEAGKAEAGKAEAGKAEAKVAEAEITEARKAEAEITEAKVAEPKPQLKIAEKNTEPKAPSPRILGWREWVWVMSPEIILRAKLDTGARTCSIHATNIETLELDGKKWVKFTISDPKSETGPHYRRKAPVVRVAKVKNDTGGLDARYVVPLTLCIGGRKLETEFTLNDRNNMFCAVLIGRNALQNLGKVDASRTDLLSKPERPAKKKKKPVPAKK
jgi:hypothetical protein